MRDAGLLLLIASLLAVTGCTLTLDFDSTVAESERDIADSMSPDEVSDAPSDIEEVDDPDGDSDPDLADASELVADVTEPECGDGRLDLASGELCDGHTECNACVPNPGFVCFGSGSSHCVQDTELPVLALSGVGETAFESVTSAGRTVPDATRYLVTSVDGAIVRTAADAGAGLRRNDEVLVIALRSQAAPGWYRFARVEGIDRNVIELGEPILPPGTADDVLVLQRVPHYQRVELTGGHRLVTEPVTLLDARDFGTISTGIVAFRVAQQVRLAGDSRIDVSSAGHAGGMVAAHGPVTAAGATLLAAAEGGPGELGASGEFVSGGNGAGDGTTLPGGVGAPGCGCPTSDDVATGGAGGAGGNAPCGGCLAFPAAGMARASGAGGSAPPTAVLSPEFAWPLERLSPGAGAAFGGGGGGAGLAIENGDDCIEASGGTLFGEGGDSTQCAGMASSVDATGKSGADGAPGGGVVWIQAASIHIEDTAGIVARGGDGGDGGDGGVTESGAGGGGGAGGDGAQGGVIVLQTPSLVAEAGSLDALGGDGGDGGHGGWGASDGPDQPEYCGGSGSGCGGRGATADGARPTAGGAALRTSSGGGGSGGAVGASGTIVLHIGDLNSVAPQPDRLASLSTPEPELLPWPAP